MIHVNPLSLAAFIFLLNSLTPSKTSQRIHAASAVAQMRPNMLSLPLCAIDGMKKAIKTDGVQFIAEVASQQRADKERVNSEGDDEMTKLINWRTRFGLS